MRRFITLAGKRVGKLRGFLLDKVIAHRGVPWQTPENSLAGLSQAASLGYAWCEIDAQVSRDGVAFLLHDFDLGGAQSDSLRYRDAAELAQVVIGVDDASGEKVTLPRLDEALALAEDCDMGLVVEIKAHEWDGSRIAHVVADTIRKAGNKKIMVSSFCDVALEAFHPLLPEIPLALNVLSLPKSVPQIYANIHFDFKRAHKAEVALLKQLDVCLYAYTVNSLSHRDRLLAMGIDGVFTDNPELLA